MTTQLPVGGEPRLDLPAPDVSHAAAAAALLADRTRAGILRMLADGPHCVCEMAAALGERDAAAVAAARAALDEVLR